MIFNRKEQKWLLSSVLQRLLQSDSSLLEASNATSEISTALKPTGETGNDSLKRIISSQEKIKQVKDSLDEIVKTISQNPSILIVLQHFMEKCQYGKKLGLQRA